MKMINPSFHILSFVWLATAVSGCATGSANITDGRYTSPLNNFSLPVPQFMFGGQMNENNDTLGGYVSFYDDTGGLYAVSYLLVPVSNAEIFGDPVQRDRAYSSYLHDVLVSEMFRSGSPKTEVVHEEFLGQGEHSELFAVVHIPEGSTMVDMFSGKRNDAMRALLIFETVGSVYGLHIATPSLLEQTDRFAPDEKKLERTRDRLQGFKETIEFR